MSSVKHVAFFPSRHSSLKVTSSSKDGTTQKQQSGLVNSGKKPETFIKTQIRATLKTGYKQKSLLAVPSLRGKIPTTLSISGTDLLLHYTRDATDLCLKIASLSYFFRETHSQIPMNFPFKKKNILISQKNTMAYLLTEVGDDNV